MHEVGSGHFASGIERRLAKSPRGRGIPAEQSAAISHDQAGALLSLPQGLKAAKIIDDKCAHSCSNTPDEIKRMGKKARRQLSNGAALVSWWNTASQGNTRGIA